MRGSLTIMVSNYIQNKNAYSKHYKSVNTLYLVAIEML